MFDLSVSRYPSLNEDDLPSVPEAVPPTVNEPVALALEDLDKLLVSGVQLLDVHEKRMLVAQIYGFSQNPQMLHLESINLQNDTEHKLLFQKMKELKNWVALLFISSIGIQELIEFGKGWLNL